MGSWCRCCTNTFYKNAGLSPVCTSIHPHTYAPLQSLWQLCHVAAGQEHHNIETPKPLKRRNPPPRLKAALPSSPRLNRTQQTAALKTLGDVQKNSVNAPHQPWAAAPPTSSSFQCSTLTKHHADLHSQPQWQTVQQASAAQTVSFALYQTTQKQQRLIEPQFAASFLQEAKQRVGQPGLPFCAKAADQREHTHTHACTRARTRTHREQGKYKQDREKVREAAQCTAEHVCHILQSKNTNEPQTCTFTIQHGSTALISVQCGVTVNKSAPSTAGHVLHVSNFNGPPVAVGSLRFQFTGICWGFISLHPKTVQSALGFTFHSTSFQQYLSSCFEKSSKSNKTKSL